MRTRNSKKTTAWIAGAFAVMTASIWGLPSVIEWLAVRGLEAQGFSPATLTVETLTPWRLVIRDLDAGGRFKAASMVAEFDPSTVFSGHFQLIELNQPTFAFEESIADGSSPARAEGEAPSPVRPRVDRLVIRDGTGTVAVPQGTITFTYAGHLTTSEDRNAEGSLDVNARGPGLDARINWQGRVPLDAPLTWRGRADIAATLDQFDLPAFDRRVSGSASGTLTGDDAGFGIDLRADAHDVSSKAHANIRGRLTASSDGAVGQDFDFPTIEFSADNVPLSGLTVSAKLALTDSKGPIAVAGGKFNLNVTATAIDGAGPVGASSLACAGEWRLDGLSLSFELAELAAKATDVATATGTRLIETVTATLSPRTEAPHQINLVFGNGGSITMAPELELAPSAFRLLPDGANLWIDLLPIRVSGFASLSGDGSRLTLATGLAKALRTTAVISGTASKARVEGTVTSAVGQPVGNFSIALGETIPLQADLAVKDLKFGAGGVAWSDVFGSLIDVRAVEGVVTATATVAPDDETVGGRAAIDVEGLSFTWSDTRFDGIAARVALDKIWPPRSTGAATIQFKKIGAGVPIENGVLGYSLPGDSTMRIDSIALQVAEGNISGGPAIVNLSARPSDLALDVAGVKLGALLNATTLDGLDGTGVIAGQLPLRIEDGALLVRDGLVAARDGVVRYRPASPSPALAAGGAIVGQALANFEYEELRATLNGDLMRDLKIAVHLKGKNPELMKGYPVEFNLNLEGPLGQIATSSLSAYRIPDTIKNRLDQESVNGAGSTKMP